MQYKKSLISSSFTLGVLLLGNASAEWKYNTEVFFAASDDASVSGIRWLQPWWQTGQALAFSDLRILKSDKKTEEANLGGGYRKLNDDETAIWGGYGFLDYRLSATNKAFTQVTLGGEYLLDKWEFRSNIYLPLKDEYTLSTLDPTTSNQDSFVGNTLTRISTTTPGGTEVEEALQGYDIEAGYLLPGAEDFEMRANLALYQFSAPVAGSTQGMRARLEAFPRENFKISFSIESDELFGTRSFLELSMPLGHKIGRPGKRSLHKRMTQFAYRDIDVRETSRLSLDKRTKNGPGTPQAIANTTVEESTPETGIAHIDSKNIVADPDGTITRPYSSIEQCVSSTSKTVNCSNSSAETIYLHASSSNTTNGVAQTYIGNISLSDGQKLIGDGITSGVFAGLSTKVSPILLGAASALSTTPVVTMGSDTTLSGLQIGWTFQQTSAGNTTTNGLPAGAMIPDKAVYIPNAKSASVSDLIITGTNGTSVPGSFSSSKNFSTGIHIFSDGLAIDNLTNSTSMSRINIDSILGDAVHADISLTTEVSVEQDITIINSSFERNGRGVHASVSGTSNNSHAKQSLQLLPDNASDDDAIANQIQLNFNEGILMENVNTLNGDTTSFTAEQSLVAQNTLIQSNQGAGIQLLLGDTGLDADNKPLTSNIELDKVSLTLNDGSGLVVESLSSNVDVTLKNTLFTANLETNRAGGNSNGRRLDLAAIDCGTAMAEANNLCSDTSATNGINRKRLTVGATTTPTVSPAFDFRRTGYGIYLKNRDSSSAASVQNITISEDFTNTLHHEDSAQIYLESINLQNSNSSQTITLTPVDEEPKKIKDPSTTFNRQFFDDQAGQTNIVDGNIVTSVNTGATSAQIAFCDNTAGVSATDTDGLSPHIQPFGGELSNITRIEDCSP